MTPPEVSILIPTYNGEKYISASIESLLEQTFENFEVVIIDDHSTDDTLGEIQKYTSNTRIKLFKNSTNVGFTETMNRAMNKAQGKYLAYQGQDDFSKPDRLERQVSALKRNSHIELVYGPADLVDQQRNKFSEWPCQNKQRTHEETFWELFWEGTFIAAPSVMMKRRHLEKFPNDRLWGRPEIEIASDYEHWLHITHDWPIYELNKPVVDITRGIDHDYAAADREKTHKEAVNVLQEMHKWYGSKPPKVSKQDVRRAVGYRLANYGKLLLLKRDHDVSMRNSQRIRLGVKSLATAFIKDPFNPHFYQEIQHGFKEAVTHYYNQIS